MPYDGTDNPLQYLLEVGNMEDPSNLYLWDLCDAELMVLNGQEGWGIYLTGLRAELIPEPSTLALLALGALGLARRRRRRSA